MRADSLPHAIPHAVLENEEEQHQLLSDYEDKCAEEVPNLTEQVETLEREAEVVEVESALQEAEARGWMANSLYLEFCSMVCCNKDCVNQ